MRHLHDPEFLRSALDYSQTTGVFTWKVKPAQCTQIGDVAGGINKRGRMMISYQRRLYQAHRLAWLYVHGSLPADQIDHIDGDRLNNAIDNLREATNQQNAANRPALRTNRHGAKGVAIARRVRKPARYRARIRVNNKLIHLGYFPTSDEAAAAYLSAAKVHFGEFACGSQRPA